jgi:hypothetical protein
MHIQTYGVGEPIPTGLELPCGGSGKVRFVSRPAGSGAIRDTVAVTYVNIAA